jgi:hypothetical protein
MREALVQTRARYISLISALLRREGLRVASGSAASFVRRVAKLALPGQLKSEIAPLLAVFVSVDRQLVWIDTRLEHLARTDGGSGLHSAAQDGSRGPRASKSKG